MIRNAAAILLLASFLLGGCGEPASGGISLGSLSGNWFGSADDAEGNLGTISVNFDNSGGFSGNTTLGPAFFGTAAHESGQIFSFALSDGTDGGFVTDGPANHAGFVDENFTFGVLEKGATALPTFRENDIIGSWSGIQVETDWVGFTATSSSVTINSDFSFSGTNGGKPFSGIFPAFSSVYGVYVFSGSSVEGAGGGQAYLSPDKTFMATWACIAGGSFPIDCSFNSWVKQ